MGVLGASPACTLIKKMALSRNLATVEIELYFNLSARVSIQGPPEDSRCISFGPFGPFGYDIIVCSRLQIFRSKAFFFLCISQHTFLVYKRWYLVNAVKLRSDIK